MENLTIIINERYDLRNPAIEKQLRANGFETVSYLDSIGAIVGKADASRIEFIEAIEGVAWVEKNPA